MKTWVAVLTVVVLLQGLSIAVGLREATARLDRQDRIMADMAVRVQLLEAMLGVQADGSADDLSSCGLRRDERT